MMSIWTNETTKSKFKILEQDIKTDVLIIGGGMAGVLCARLLEQQGVNYMLVEADTIGGGITKNTTAKITAQHGLIYSKLVKKRGIECAKRYLEINEIAIKKYRELSKVISCEFEEKSAFVYGREHREKLEQEMDALKLIGVHPDFHDEIRLPFSVVGAIEFKNQAQFQPLKFLYGIAQGLNIYEHTFVREVKDQKAFTDHGIISAEKIIVATHFPFLNKYGGYFLKIYQHRSYVIALEQAPNINGMYVDQAEKGMSFRNYKDLLLVGGGDHRTGKQGGNWKELREFADKYYPRAKEAYAWATQDCMPLDDVPYIGQYSKHTPNLYVATGFHKWGMTTSMAAAMLLTDIILEKDNPYQELFAPNRSMWNKQLAVNSWEAILNILTPTIPRCPHLGCALTWNQVEHTWDCPCHGSRFEQTGELIDNPSIKCASIISKEKGKINSKTKEGGKL